MTRRTVVVGLALAGVVALPACTDEPGPSPTSSASPSPTPSPSPSPSPSTSPTTSPSPSASGGAFEGFATAPRESKGWPDAGGSLGLGTAVRFGRHQRYDRVVYQFSDDGPVGYQVKYVSEPVAEGSGDVVEVAGDAYLQVLVAGLGYPENDEQPPAEVPASRLRGTVVAEALPLFAGFEGVGQAFVGVRGGERSFRVTALREPTRLVVDIAR